MRSIRLVEVSGPSMVPTLRSGDVVLVVRPLRVAPGQVVLARFADLPGRLVVKRAVRPVAGGWWVVSDNPYAAGDSVAHGAAEVVGRVVWRVGPGLARLLRGRISGPPEESAPS